MSSPPSLIDAIPSRRSDRATPPPGTARALIVVGTLVAGIALWRVSHGDLYTSGSTLGYYLGVIGGSMMLALLTYPVRKRAASLKDAGPLRHWFRAHMTLGILGPLCILFHSTLHVGSLNAAVALGCMLLVAASGVVGRFIYRQIHHGLYGARATVEELQKSLNTQMIELEPTFQRVAEVRIAVANFVERSHAVPPRLGARALHFLLLYWHRPLVRRRIRRALIPQSAHPVQRTHLASLAGTIDELLIAVHQHSQFSTYERLFSLWHVAHLPFVYMLLASAIVHVVAVHMY